MSPKSAAGAAILTGTIELTQAPQPEREIRVPAIRRIIRTQRPPLDLDALRFCYRHDGETVTPVREKHTRACHSHGRH